MIMISGVQLLFQKLRSDLSGVCPAWVRTPEFIRDKCARSGHGLSARQWRQVARVVAPEDMLSVRQIVFRPRRLPGMALAASSRPAQMGSPLSTVRQ
jgi:hypothetical protein